ncbi:hypothetical protein JB92DRAFT_2870203 [Gautieria morchelliformis]|nr:hypothetical protein JB92DRAFT_2870203 [Gautieria morchelliformis]
MWRKHILWTKSEPQQSSRRRVHNYHGNASLATDDLTRGTGQTTPQRVHDEQAQGIDDEDSESDDSGFSVDYSGEGHQGIYRHSYPQEAWAGPSRQAHVPQGPSLTLTHILSATKDRRRAISPSHPRLTTSGVAANEDVVLDKDASVSDRGVSAQAPQQYRARPLLRLRAAQPPSDHFPKKSPAAGHTEARGRVKLILRPSVPQRVSAENSTRVDENMSEGVASDEGMSATVISGDDVASDIVLDEDDEDEAYESDTSDGDYVVPEVPPHHTRAGPSRRTQAPKPAPSTGTRVHKPQKKASKKDRRRATVTLDLSLLQRVRGDYLNFLKGQLVPKGYEVQRPVRAQRCWECVTCKHGCGRKAEAERHMLTHHAIRWLCGNPKCPQLFARKDAVKRHIKETPSCKTKLLRGTSLGTETPIVLVDEQNGRVEDVNLVDIVWID